MVITITTKGMVIRKTTTKSMAMAAKEVMATMVLEVNTEANTTRAAVVIVIMAVDTVMDTKNYGFKSKIIFSC